MSRPHDFVLRSALFFCRRGEEKYFQISSEAVCGYSLKPWSRHRMVVAMVRIPYLTPSASTLRRKRIRNHTDDGDHYSNQCIRPQLGAVFSFNSTAVLVFPPATTGAQIVSTNFSCCHTRNSNASILRRRCQTIQRTKQPHSK